MGTTLQAIVEIEFAAVLAPPGCERRSHWQSVCSWEFGKDYEFMSLLSEWLKKGLVNDGWPHTSPEFDDDGYTANSQRTQSRREVDRKDIAFGRMWMTASSFEKCAEWECSFDYGAVSTQLRALADAVEALAHDLGGDHVRILWYRL